MPPLSGLCAVQIIASCPGAVVASLAATLVGALNIFLCFFHADFCSAEWCTVRTLSLTTGTFWRVAKW